MDPDTICLCGHKNNSHSDSGCQFAECSCEKWREFKSEKLGTESKRNANSATRKIAERFGKMNKHKVQLMKDSDELKIEKVSESAKISKSEKWDNEDLQQDGLDELRKKQDWKKIDEQLEISLKIKHENVDIWIQKGQNFLNWEKDDDALYCFKNALMFDRNQDNKFNKKDYEILNNLSKIYHDKKDYPEAIKYGEESVKIKPEYIPALKRLGLIYINLGDDEKAKKSFEKVLEQKSDDTNALDNLGYVHQYNEEYDEAINFFSKSKQLKDEENTDIYSETHEAYCYLMKNDLEHAELLINKEKIKENEIAFSYYVRGKIYSAAEKFNEAIENYEKEFGWTKVRDGIWFDLGYCNQLIGNYQLCVEYYQKSLEYEKLSTGAAQNLGDAYTSLGQYENAHKWYDSGLEKFPDSTNLLNNKASLYEKQSQYDDAIKCYDKILEKNPADLCASKWKAGCLSFNGNPGGAIQIFEAIQNALMQSETIPQDSENKILTEEDLFWKFIATPPDREECYLEKEDLLNAISWQWIKIGNYEKSLKFIEQALEINREKASITHTKALALKNLGRFEEAKEWFEKTVEIEKTEEYEIEIGICHRKAGNSLDENNKEKHNIESIKIFDSILEKNNSSSKAWYEKSLCYWNLKQFDDAKNCLEHAVKINPHKKEHWFELGEIARTQIKPLQAIFYYDKSIKIKATGEDYHGKSLALEKLEKHSDAIECLNTAIKIYDETTLLFPFGHEVKQIAIFWKEKGGNYDSLKNYNDAINCYDEALELEPKYVVALNNKGNTLRKMKKYSDAIECLDTSIKINPESYYPHHRRTLAYLEWGKYSDAIKLTENLLEQFPEESERTMTLLVDTYKKTGETSKQKEYEEKLQKVMDLKNNKTNGV